MASLGMLRMDSLMQAGIKVDSDGYAKIPDEDDEESAVPADKEFSRTWISLFFAAFIYVWPEKKALQMRATFCFVLLLSMRGFNLAVPILYKRLVDAMANAHIDGASPESYWALVYPWPVLYLSCILFQGGAGGGMTGLINNLRSYLWIPVAQDAFKRVSLRVFSHVMSLDLSFHLSKKTGEVTRQVSRGTDAMQNILSTILFSIVPQLIDVFTASTYLAQPAIAIIMFVTVASYMPITIIITEWRGNLRREVNRTDQACSARVTDALINYETVKYFTNDKHEADKFQEAIEEYQVAEYKSSASLNLLNVVQSLIMFGGMSSGLLLCVNGVYQGRLSVGDVVLFIAMMSQLYTPLTWFGTNYSPAALHSPNLVQDKLQNLFSLLDRKSAVVDTPRSKELVIKEGAVEFEHVWLEYEHNNPVLKGVSFDCPGGSTIAFVGATGSGKSTIARLMFRLAIGMVPQDTVLFNDTIMLNIRYGAVGAPDEMVIEAAKAACIHETITTRFPKSLKNPSIMVLDEATSALDSITEKKIQEALLGMRKKRTTMIIAHRLSTIADADTIVVMDKGTIVEMGNHEQLLSKQGLYAEMWSKQSHDDSSVGGSRAGTPLGSSLNLVEEGKSG
eukprot:gene28995-32187_t